MKKKTTLLKSLLIAAAVMTGVNGAWAEVTPFSESYSSTSTADGWNTKTGGRFTPVVLSEDDNYFLSVTQGERNNNGSTVTGSVIAGKAAAGDDFTLSFDMRLSNSNNQSPVSLEIKDAVNTGVIFSLTATDKNVTTWKVNGTDLKLDLPNSGGGKGILDITWISYKISRSGALTYLTVTNKETDEVILARQTVNGASENGGLGNIVFTTRRYNANFGIDNIVVRELQDGDVPAVTPVNYTIKYVNENDVEIADAIEVASYVGAEISASADQVEPVYYNGKKYLYKSGNENPITLVNDENANIIKLVYREAAAFKYTVNAVDGESNVLKQLASTSGFEGDELNFAYPTYVLNEGKLWNCGATESSYKKTFNLTSDNQVFTITYSATDIEDVVFYAEAEDVEGMTAYRSGNADARSSQAAMGYSAEDVVFTTLPAGKYKLTFVQFKSTSGDGTMTFVVGDNEFSQTTASNNWASKTFDEFTLYKETNVVLKAGGSKDLGVDFVYIVKTGDVDAQTVSVAITSEAELATYVNGNCALDFSNVEGLTAWIVTGIDGVAHLQQVKKVPAGVGIILQGAPKTYEVPVIAAADAIEGNLLKAAITETTAVEGDYVLAYKSDVRGFFPAEVDLKIPAGKAYLHIDTEGEAPAFLPFAAETTGIGATLVNSEVVNNEVYNLAGQRVAQPTKGLYIVGGRKVVVK